MSDAAIQIVSRQAKVTQSACYVQLLKLATRPRLNVRGEAGGFGADEQFRRGFVREGRATQDTGPRA